MGYDDDDEDVSVAAGWMVILGFLLVAVLAFIFIFAS